jgi:succinate dehydrogenase/fumarate reductase flavoprotein subunit
MKRHHPTRERGVLTPRDQVAQAYQKEVMSGQFSNLR